MIWEYRVVYIHHLKLQEDLNNVGETGWELVSVDWGNGGTYCCILKRPVEAVRKR